MEQIFQGTNFNGIFEQF